MTKQFLTFIIVLNICFSVFGDELGDFSGLDLKPSSSLAGTDGLASTLIDGSMSAITGAPALRAEAEKIDFLSPKGWRIKA